MALTANERGFAIQTFTTSLKLLSQQIESEFTSAVTVVNGLVGYQAQVVRQIAPVAAKKINGRLEPIVLDATLNDSRWVAPNDYRWATGIDRFEMLRTNVMPTGEYTRAAVAAMNRARDLEIINGIFGVNASGPRGLDPVPFDTTNQVIGVNTGGASPLGMNMQKLIEAKAVFNKNYAAQPGDEMYIALSATQIKNLENDELVISGLYQNNKVLTDGVLRQVLGINIVHSEFLPVDGNGYRRCPIWVKSGIVLGVWQDIIASIDQRLDIEGLPYQIYSMQTMGATRTEEKKVIEIKCNEAA